MFRNFELKLYELMGIKFFKRVILRFEAIKHFKDSGKNSNYHIRGTSSISLDSSFAFFIYNSIFHFTSILLIFLYFAISQAVLFNSLAINIGMVILFILNVYCIILQRYNYLRLKLILEKRAKRNEKKIRDYKEHILNCLEKKRKADLLEEYSLIKELYESAVLGIDYFIPKSSESVLRRIASISCEIDNSQLFVPVFNTDKELIKSICANSQVISNPEMRIFRIQTLLRAFFPKSILYGFSVITESYGCEKAFRYGLYRKDSDSEMVVFESLYDAYSTFMGR